MTRLNKVIITNFRNINYAEYDLKKMNIFYGPNTKGKTNTILSIYWALSDYLMDGSSDYPSFKPHSDSKAEVSVELQFDGFTFAKTYSEKWVKTRGSSEVTMQGHDTQYFIDDVKYSVNEGKRLLIEKLGLDTLKVHKKIDVIRAIVDPYYLAQQVPWKDLRTFIIDLVGDVDDFSVLNSNHNYLTIKEDLAKHKFDVSTLTKLYKQNIKKSSEEITKLENIVIGYKDINDVDSSELAKAEANIVFIDNDIAALKVRKQSDVNPKISQLEQEISKIRLEYSESLDADRKHLNQLNETINAEISKLENLSDEKNNELTKVQKKRRELEGELNEYRFKLTSLTNEKEEKKTQKERLLNEWDQLDNLEYQSSLIINKCPHCGEILNQEELEKNKINWEKDKQLKLDDIVSKGKKIANDIENLDFKLNELKEPTDFSDDTYILSLENEIKDINKRILELRASRTAEYVSDNTKHLLQKGNSLKKQLDEEKEKITIEDIDVQIYEKTKEKEVFNKVIADHNAFLAIQDKIKQVEKQILSNQTALAETETKHMLLEDFIKTKLTLLNENVASVFGNLEFVLVESNIKEGSYNEVCYPLILGSQTAYSSGSGAEKIITGVYIIECVKKALEIHDLPIIFDEADKLDTQTIAKKLETNSQIISTKVDDVNYEVVTLVTK